MQNEKWRGIVDSFQLLLIFTPKIITDFFEKVKSFFDFLRGFLLDFLNFL